MKRKICMAVLTVLMVFALMPTVFAATSGTCGENLNWVLTADQRLIIFGTGEMWDYSREKAPWYSQAYWFNKVVINEGVTNIGDYAFYDCGNITSVELPESLTSIGNRAFYSCDSLASIELPGRLAGIDHFAFYDCSNLISIDLPDSVTSIGNYAFSGCSSLNSIVIPDGVTSIGDSAFDRCSNLINVELPDSVTSIENYAFANCSNLTSIAIPDGVTSIGEGVFYRCSSLNSIVIPDGVTSIGEWAFARCSGLTSITIPDSVTVIRSYAFYYCDNLTDVYFDGTEEAWNSAINSADVFSTEVNLHCHIHDWNTGEVTTKATCTTEGVKTYTCLGCGETKTETIAATGHDYKTEVVAPTCKEQGYTLHTCKNCGDSYKDTYTAIVDHNWDSGKVTTRATCTTDGVKTYTCTGCGKTKTEKIAATGHNWDSGKVTTKATCTTDGVKTYTCMGCSKTKTEKIAATGHNWDSGKITTEATCTTDGVKTYTCTGCGKTKTEKIAATGHNYETKVVESTCAEKGYTLHTCKNCGDSYKDTYVDELGHNWGNEVVFEEPTYTSTGNNLYSCTKCGATKMKATARKIDGYLNSAKTVAWGLDGDTLIISGSGAIPDYTTTADRPWNTISIEYKIKTIVIEDGITRIGEKAFYTMPNLEKVMMANSVTSIGKNAFFLCDDLLEINFSTSLKTIGDYAFCGAAGIKTINLPDSVTSIGNSAFCLCKGLTKVVLPNKLAVLNRHVFDGCENLKQLYIRSFLKQIETAALDGCPKLTDIYYRHEKKYWRAIPKGSLNEVLNSATIHYKYTTCELHNYTETVTQPTCSQRGYTTYECKKCGISFKGNYQNATGHNWDNGKVTTNASCETDLVMTYTCQNCGKTKTATMKGTGHSWDSGTVTKEPAALESGEKVYTCSVCGKTKTERLAALNNPFEDLVLNSSYYDPVLWAVDKGITTGTSKTEFSPKATCTRAQIVTFLWRAAGSPEPTSMNHNFKDIVEGSSYYKAVLWAVEKGITTGMDKTHFGPKEPCTRAQIVTFLWRYAGEPEPTSMSHKFKDIVEGSSYYKAVLWAVEKGITTGSDDTHFSPKNPCTRAQGMTFLWRYNNNK